MKEFTLPYRQVHLDFHTSELIPGVGSQFKKEEFQAALKAGHVNSITVFSKCHHGYAYHPTKVHQMHPSLNFDLLGAQLEACREIGVAAPVYISAGLDEKEAVRHPEWLSRSKDDKLGWTPDFESPGYHLLCYNTGYLDLLAAQVEEVMQLYNPVGVFLDISAVRTCYCKNCRKTLEEMGKSVDDYDAVLQLGEQVYANYCKRMEDAVRKYNPDTRIFHNAGHISRGRRDLMGYDTHLELESLPTGGWGYDHFPISAAYTGTVGMEYLGMTGKFHTTWGEFGGFKHPNALRYETALSIALGSKCSIGDQLHPNGKMDMSTYELIGKAYSEVEAKERWCDGAKNIADIAVLSEQAVNTKISNSGSSDHGDVGANRILMEGNYLYSVIDLDCDFEPYKLLILPDTIRVDSTLADRLNKYLAGGGKLLCSGKSGLYTDRDEFAVPLGVIYTGACTYKPTYIRPAFQTTNLPTAFVMYENSYDITLDGAKETASRENPYFNREKRNFCSHQHTPNNPEYAGAGVAVTDNTAYIAWEIFTDYAKTGSLHLKETVIAALEHLIGKKKTLTASMPDKGVVTLTKQDSRFINHLLFAHTTIRGYRWGKPIEVIEDIVPLYNIAVSVKTEKTPKRVYLAPQMDEIPFRYENNTVSYTIPVVECHQMVVIDC